MFDSESESDVDVDVVVVVVEAPWPWTATFATVSPLFWLHPLEEQKNVFDFNSSWNSYWLTFTKIKQIYWN